MPLDHASIVTIGNHLVAIGLVVVFVAIGFELLAVELSGLAVGVGLVVIGFLVLVVDAVGVGRPPAVATCDDCGSPSDADATECPHCGTAF